MKSTKKLAHGAIIAALYLALSLGQDLLFPGSGSMVLQFRAAEALCVLALFTPSAIYGLSLGCLLYNFFQAGTLPLDFLMGTAASFLAACAMYALRNVRLWKLPLLSLLMPAVFNGFFVGWELSIYLGETPLWMSILWVCLGELAVLFTLGLALYLLLSRSSISRQLFGP